MMPSGLTNTTGMDQCGTCMISFERKKGATDDRADNMLHFLNQYQTIKA